MVTSAFVLAFAAGSMGATIPEQIVERQNDVFQEFWGTDFSWKFEDLPEKSSIPEFRVPYSGYIYLDTAGGTINAMRKYDYAFHGGRMNATAFEQWDTTAFQKPVSRRAGLFGFRTTTVMSTPNWHGHCNGWAAAAIRHAEPQNSVRRNGVVFSPADIKAMLAEIYIYNETRDLIRSNESVNAGVFHAIITNWVGRGMHPIGLEADPGEEKWNYPIYDYSTSSARRSDREVDVRMTLVYANSTNRESHQSPRIARNKSFHYRLNLNDAGEIIGGYFYRGSSQIDMLWIPVRPKQGRKPGNERGNPHVDVDEVLAIWRDSVPVEVRDKWPVIDPPEADRIADTSQIAGLVPLQQKPLAEVDQVATADDATPSEAADADADADAAMTEEADGDAAEPTESDVDAAGDSDAVADPPVADPPVAEPAVAEPPVAEPAVAEPAVAEAAVTTG